MRNADLDDLKDQNYAEAVKAERAEMQAMTTTPSPEAVALAKAIKEEIGRAGGVQRHDLWLPLIDAALTAARNKTLDDAASLVENNLMAQSRRASAEAIARSIRNLRGTK